MSNVNAVILVIVILKLSHDQLIDFDNGIRYISTNSCEKVSHLKSFTLFASNVISLFYI